MDKDQAREKFKLADRLFNEQQFGPALKVLTELNSAFPNERHILYPMARCLAGLGRNGEAIDLADRIVRQFDYSPAMELYKKLKSMKAGGGLAALESGSDPDLMMAVPSLDSDPVVDLPPGVPTLDSDPVMPLPGMPKFDSDPPPLPKDLDALVSSSFGSKTAVPPRVPAAAGSSRNAVLLWVGLAAGSVLIYLAAAATVGRPMLEFQQRAAEDPSFMENSENPFAEFPFGSMGAMFVVGCITSLLISCFPGYWSLRILDALPMNDFGEDMKDIALYTLFGFLLSPILVIGWIIFLVILAKHYELSFGKLVGVVVLWILFDILVWIPVWIVMQVVTASVLA